jgi:gas vesicle protein
MESDIIGMKGNRNMELPCFALGLGAGVALTLLFAPSGGEKLRREINRRVQDGGKWVKDQADYVSSTAEGLRDKAAEVAEIITR